MYRSCVWSQSYYLQTKELSEIGGQWWLAHIISWWSLRVDGRWGQDGSAVTQKEAGIAQEKLVVIFKTVNVLNRTRAVSS